MRISHTETKFVRPRRFSSAILTSHIYQQLLHRLASKVDDMSGHAFLQCCDRDRRPSAAATRSAVEWLVGCWQCASILHADISARLLMNRSSSSSRPAPAAASSSSSSSSSSSRADRLLMSSSSSPPIPAVQGDEWEEVGLGGLSLGSAAPPNALNESVAEQYAHGVLTQAQTLTNARSMIEMAYRNNPNWRTWSREMFQANAPTLFRSIIRSQPADNALDRAADEGRLFNALVHLNPDWGSLPSDGLKLLLKQIESGYEALTHGEKSQQVLDDLASHRAILGDSLRALFQLRADRDAALPPNSSELTKMVHQLGDDWSGFKLKPRFIYVGSDTMRLTQVLVGVRTNVTPFATDAISRSRLRHRIKIGSTSNIKSRGNVYRSHNPDFRIWAFFAVSPKGDNALSRKQIEHVERAVHNRVEAAYAAEFVRRGEWFESTATGAHGPLGSANRVNQLLTFIRDTIVADDPGASGHETFPNDLTNRLPLTVQLQRDWDIVFAQ